MTIQYPVFIMARDDRSIRKVAKQAELAYYEQIDIEAGEYSGWDVQGYPIILSWEPKAGLKVEIVDRMPQPGMLRQAILDYAERYRGVPLRREASACSVVELFDAAEQHIRGAQPRSLAERIRRFFGRTDRDHPLC